MNALTRLMAEIQYRICMADRYLAEMRGDKLAAANAYQDACRIRSDWELEQLIGEMK